MPLEQLIKFSNVKFMRNYSHGKLPFSFSEMWITNRNRNPNVELRNADDYYVPAHRMASVKRFPFFSFPKIWNEEPFTKRNPSKTVYLKSVKSAFLALL